MNGRLTFLSGTAATLGAVAAAALAVLGTPDPAITTVYPAPHPRGLMATSGGWVYCEQTVPIARRLGYTLICGRYYKDKYLGPGLRSRRHLDWGNPQYLTRFAAKIRAAHRQTGGDLILVGVSYAGRTYEEGKKITWKDGIRALWCIAKYSRSRSQAQ